MRKAASLLAAWAVLAGTPASAEAVRGGRYTPSFSTFSCELPGPDWRAFEDEEPAGPMVRLMGPEDPAGVYRTGIDIRLVEKGQPGFVPWKEAVEKMRKGGKGRSASALRPLRIPAALARVFQLEEKRWLPEDRLPAQERPIHRYVAVVPSGDSYFLVTLSSSRDVYLDYREPFVAFLKTFRPLGAR